MRQIPGANVEDITIDTWYVTKGTAKVTVYDNGEMVAEKIEVWDGTSIKVPEIKDFNWYIYNAPQMKFFADFVNNGNTLTDDQKVLVAEAGYEESEIIITDDTIVNLMANIDLGARQKNGELITGTAWTPIYPSSTLKSGTFDGNGHYIKGIYVSTTANLVGGLFGRSYNTIQNITIKDSYVYSSGGCIGGVVGFFQGEDIEITNCHNVNTTVISDFFTSGGIVGQFNGINIKNCTNSGTVSASLYSNGDSRAGGICGCIANATCISNCQNFGKVNATGNMVGGIIGCLGYSEANPIITNCTNLGGVLGNGAVGGIVGVADYTVAIDKCSNSGSVSGIANYVGGIIGLVGSDGKDPSTKEPTVISYCYNSGNVESEQLYAVGGIVGGACQYGTIIEKSYNLGKIQGKERIGGIAGDLGRSSQVKNCYNVGEIIGTLEGKVSIGGIVGYTYYSVGSITNSYNLGIITGKENVGGILGQNTNSATIMNSYYLEGTANLDEGTGNTANLAKLAEYIKTTFVTNANMTEKIWEIEEGKNNGYPIIIGIE